MIEKHDLVYLVNDAGELVDDQTEAEIYEVVGFSHREGQVILQWPISQNELLNTYPINCLRKVGESIHKPVKENVDVEVDTAKFSIGDVVVTGYRRTHLGHTFPTYQVGTVTAVKFIVTAEDERVEYDIQDEHGSIHEGILEKHLQLVDDFAETMKKKLLSKDGEPEGEYPIA